MLPLLRLKNSSTFAYLLSQEKYFPKKDSLSPSHSMDPNQPAYYLSIECTILEQLPTIGMKPSLPFP